MKITLPPAEEQKKPTAQKPKLKQAKITVQFYDWADLQIALIKAKDKLRNGNQHAENQSDKASYTASIEFLEKTNYTEKQINEKWYQIAKSNI